MESIIPEKLHNQSLRIELELDVGILVRYSCGGNDW